MKRSNLKRIAIIFALFYEVRPLARKLGVPFLKGTRSQIILDGKNLALVRAGIGKDRAMEAAEKVVLEFRPEIIISAGLCGALVEDLKVGDIVVSDFNDGKIFCSPRPLLTYNEKLNAHREHSAVVVDMESEGVRIIAGKYNIPSIAIKVVSDGLKDDIPKSLLTLTSLLKLIRFKHSMDIASNRLSEFLLDYIKKN